MNILFVLGSGRRRSRHPAGERDEGAEGVKIRLRELLYKAGLVAVVVSTAALLALFNSAAVGKINR